ncbi:hypothetical protein CR513_38964, partial [Mucuna pruriens]
MTKSDSEFVTGQARDPYDFPLDRRSTQRPFSGQETPKGSRQIYLNIPIAGVCKTHIGRRVLVSKVARVGYYWPTLKRDCTEFVKRFDKCQRYANLHKAPENTSTL